jgi:hypothetical protein
MTRKKDTAMKAIRETIVQAILILIVFNLFGCAGIPISAAGYQPMTQSQIVTGVYAVFSGQQPISWLFSAPGSDLRVLFWPGATNSGETLINMVCLQSCAPGWERIGAGFAMTGQRASQFAEYLKAGGWQQIAPVAASVAPKGLTFWQWMQVARNTMTGMIMIFPAGVVPVEPTEAKS